MFNLSRVETKVYAGAVGTGVGAGLGTFVTWLLGVTVWGISDSASNASAAIAAVPSPVAKLIPIALAVLGSLIGGYSAAPSNHAGNDLTDLQSASIEPTDVEVGDQGLDRPTVQAGADIPEDTDDFVTARPIQ